MRELLMLLGVVDATHRAVLSMVAGRTVSKLQVVCDGREWQGTLAAAASYDRCAHTFLLAIASRSLHLLGQ